MDLQPLYVLRLQRFPNYTGHYHRSNAGTHDLRFNRDWMGSV